MIVTDTTNLCYVAGKGVSAVKSNTWVPNCISRGDRISKKLGGKFFYEGLSGLSITNDNEFSFLWVEFQFHTIHPLLNTGETLSKLSKTRIKVPMVKCQIYLGVIST